jgi:hypothetical protein
MLVLVEALAAAPAAGLLAEEGVAAGVFGVDPGWPGGLVVVVGEVPCILLPPGSRPGVGDGDLGVLVAGALPGAGEGVVGVVVPGLAVGGLGAGEGELGAVGAAIVEDAAVADGREKATASA